MRGSREEAAADWRRPESLWAAPQARKSAGVAYGAIDAAVKRGTERTENRSDALPPQDQQGEAGPQARVPRQDADEERPQDHQQQAPGRQAGAGRLSWTQATQSTAGSGPTKQSRNKRRG